MDTKSSASKSLNNHPISEEVEKKRKIMEYLKIVKNKISQMESKLGEATQKADFYQKNNQNLESQLHYYKTKSEELEFSREKAIENEKLMAMKYGIILSQNKELFNKYKKVKNENEDLKSQILSFTHKECISDTISNDIHSKSLNKTTKNHKRDYSSPVINKNMPICHSSASLINNGNLQELDCANKPGGRVKMINKQIDPDPMLLGKIEKLNQKITYDEVHLAKGQKETQDINLLSTTQK